MSDSFVSACADGTLVYIPDELHDASQHARYNKGFVMACQMDRLNVVQFFLTKPCDHILALSAGFRSAIHNGHVDVVAQLVADYAYELDLNTVIYTIAHNNTVSNIDVMRTLINSKYVDLNSTLVSVVASNDTDLVQAVVGRGANNFDAAITRAARLGCINSIKVLHSFAKNIPTALIDAAYAGQLEATQLLLSYYDDEPSSRATIYATALKGAMFIAHAPLIHMLLQAFTRVGATHEHWCMVFCATCECDAKEGFEAIIKFIAPDIIDWNMPLNAAILYDRLYMVEQIIKRTSTPLDWSSAFLQMCQNGSHDVLDFMLNTKQLTPYELIAKLPTALMLACENGELRTITRLITYMESTDDVDLNPGITGACRGGHLDVFEFLMDRSTQSQFYVIDLQNALEEAVMSDHPKLVEKIIGLIPNHAYIRTLIPLSTAHGFHGVTRVLIANLKSPPTMDI
jgi:hypothetical protein